MTCHDVCRVVVVIGIYGSTSCVNIDSLHPGVWRLPSEGILTFPSVAMVVRLRLQRFGMRNHPFYRIVAADSRFPRDGRFIERVTSYPYFIIVIFLS